MLRLLLPRLTAFDSPLARHAAGPARALRCAACALQVIVTPHSAFLTREALANIATTTCQNIADWKLGKPIGNEVKAQPAK